MGSPTAIGCGPRNDRLSVEYLFDALRVDDDTGRIYWRQRPREHFASDRGYGFFRSHYEGRLADEGRYPLNGYRRIRITVAGRALTVSAHRAAFALYFGRWPDAEVDHIDGDRTNNRRSNLRELTHQQNMHAAFARRAGHQFTGDVYHV